MARQVRLEDDIADYVEQSGPESDSLAAKANRLLRRLHDADLRADRAVDFDDPITVPSPEVAMPQARVRPARARTRVRPVPDDPADIIRALNQPPTASTVPASNGLAVCSHPLLLRHGTTCGRCGDTV